MFRLFESPTAPYAFLLLILHYLFKQINVNEQRLAPVPDDFCERFTVMRNQLVNEADDVLHRISKLLIYVAYARHFLLQSISLIAIGTR